MPDPLFTEALYASLQTDTEFGKLMRRHFAQAGESMQYLIRPIKNISASQS